MATNGIITIGLMDKDLILQESSLAPDQLLVSNRDEAFTDTNESQYKQLKGAMEKVLLEDLATPKKM